MTETTSNFLSDFPTILQSDDLRKCKVLLKLFSSSKLSKYGHTC